MKKLANLLKMQSEIVISMKEIEKVRWRMESVCQDIDRALQSEVLPDEKKQAMRVAVDKSKYLYVTSLRDINKQLEYFEKVFAGQNFFIKGLLNLVARLAY